MNIIRNAFWILALCGLFSLQAAVLPGENIVINGNFEAEQLAFPQFWTCNPESLVSFSPTGGPDSVGAVTFSNPEELSGVATVRQFDARLVAGETYKMSVWVRTKDFFSNHCGVIAHNNGWHSSQGVTIFPATTDGWQYLEETFAAAESADGAYGIALFAQHFKGSIEFAKVKLEAISPGALAGSMASPIISEQSRLRLVPWAPLLHKIPVAEPRLSFHLFGQPAQGDGLQDYDCVYTVNGQVKQRQALQPAINTVDLQGMKAGTYQLEYAVVKRGNQEKVFSRTQGITLINLAPVDQSNHRRLNNVVTEILSKDLAATAAEQTFTFDNPKDGWVYIVVQTPAPGANLALQVADLGVVITADTDRTETFRHLPRGRHVVKVQGVNAGGRLVVRAIAEIFNYPACANSQIPQNGKYDWDFLVKYVFPAVTTLNGGTIPAENLPELKARGLRWLANLGTTSPKSAEDLIDRIQNCSGINDPRYDGVTCDEQFFSQASIYHYTEALWNYTSPSDRLIYTWIVGKPGLRGIHNDFISASANASASRGRMLYEAYCHSQPTEKDAATYLQNRVVDTMNGFLEYFPGIAPNCGIQFGNFNQIPIISLDVNPEVDYKYFLDMQLNLLANHPSFRDLGTTGYWGSYYDDEELYRWSFELLRHYCVEGNTTMLSEQYGYRYNPGYLSNCDFINGLSDWTVNAATADSVTKASFQGYGSGSQRRWGGGPGIGDTFCLFKRQDGRTNSISQQVKGLVPGKVYTLQFVTADYQDMVNKRFNPRRHGINAVLGSAVEVLEDQSYVFVDARNGGNKKDDGLARVNLHHIRFRPTAPSFTVTFNDADAEPGDELTLNYIMMKPYFER